MHNAAPIIRQSERLWQASHPEVILYAAGSSILNASIKERAVLATLDEYTAAEATFKLPICLFCIKLLAGRKYTLEWTNCCSSYLSSQESRLSEKTRHVIPPHRLAHPQQRVGRCASNHEVLRRLYCANGVGACQVGRQIGLQPGHHGAHKVRPEPASYTS